MVRRKLKVEGIMNEARHVIIEYINFQTSKRFMTTKVYSQYNIHIHKTSKTHRSIDHGGAASQIRQRQQRPLHV